jgi:hypothetical protein
VCFSSISDQETDGATFGNDAILQSNYSPDLPASTAVSLLYGLPAICTRVVLTTLGVVKTGRALISHTTQQSNTRFVLEGTRHSLGTCSSSVHSSFELMHKEADGIQFQYPHHTLQVKRVSRLTPRPNCTMVLNHYCTPQVDNANCPKCFHYLCGLCTWELE